MWHINRESICHIVSKVQGYRLMCVKDSPINQLTEWLGAFPGCLVSGELVTPRLGLLNLKGVVSPSIVASTLPHTALKVFNKELLLRYSRFNFRRVLKMPNHRDCSATAIFMLSSITILKLLSYKLHTHSSYFLKDIPSHF